MGKKGDKQTNASAESAENLQDKLFPLGEIRLKKMFGGHGVFYEETMFSLVDSKGTVFFKVDDSNKHRFEDAGAEKHGRMPYYQVPEQILSNDKTLQEWAKVSVDIAVRGKK